MSPAHTCHQSSNLTLRLGTAFEKARFLFYREANYNEAQ
jgi:hypothetical protein